MKLKKYIFTILFFAILILACSSDDDNNVSLVEDRDRTEQQVTDRALLQTYLQTHYYNSGELTGLINPEFSDIIITELADGETVPADATLLIDAVETRTTVFEETSYEYYILKINQGGGNSPNFTDILRVKYEGSSIETSNIFDFRTSATDISLVQDLVGNSGTIRAWQLVFPNFSAAENFNIQTDGVVSFNNFGLGVMFIPSGLGFFSGTSTGVVYDNIIFKFELLQFQVTDSDNDGIPSYIEDLNNDLDVFDEDTDEDLIVNYLDIDDDGDGVLTINELEHNERVFNTNLGEIEPILGPNEYEVDRTDESGIITIQTVTALDTNNNGILDYLDEAVTIDYLEDE